MPSNQLHNKRLPRRVHTNSVRQLFRKRHGRRETDQPGTVGHGRARRLRQIKTFIISTNRRLSHMLFARQPSFVRERQSKSKTRGIYVTRNELSSVVSKTTELFIRDKVFRKFGN